MTARERETGRGYGCNGSTPIRQGKNNLQNRSAMSSRVSFSRLSHHVKRRFSTSDLPRFRVLLSHCPTVALTSFLAVSAWADWPVNNTNVVKWLQGPDPTINGFDVLVGQGKQPGAPAIILANDFQCTKTGPITDIHLWTSWFGFN